MLEDFLQFQCWRIYILYSFRKAGESRTLSNLQDQWLGIFSFLQSQPCMVHKKTTIGTRMNTEWPPMLVCFGVRAARNVEGQFTYCDR